MEVHHQQFRGVQVFGGEPEDQLGQYTALDCRISDLGRLNEVLMQSVCEERVGQRAEVRLEDRCYTGDIVEPVRVAKIERLVVASFE